MPSSSKIFGKMVHKDPENYVMIGSLCAIFAVAGYHLTKKNLDATTDSVVLPDNSALPWQDPNVPKDAEKTFKYRYHPHNDKSLPMKDAPPAMNEVIKTAMTTKEAQEHLKK